MPPSRIPGALGSNLAAGITGMHIFLDIKGAVAKRVLTAAERELFKDALKKVGSRLAGHLARESPAWIRAFAHIAEQHFGEVVGKATNGIFLQEFRNPTAIETLVRQAATRPERKVVLAASHALNTSGKPVIMVERTFGKVLGQIGPQANAAECRVLRMFFDLTGRLQTAFPAEALLKL